MTRAISEPSVWPLYNLTTARRVDRSLRATSATSHDQEIIIVHFQRTRATHEDECEEHTGAWMHAL